MTDDERPSVLVIDDEAAIADLYADWLDGDYDVVTAHDADEAIGALDASIDVVLLDRRMPGRSGDDVVAEIRTRDLDTRIAMVTAVSPDVDVVTIGFDAYLVKPVRADDLIETVERLLRVADYDDELQTLYSLATKKALLETERPVHTLVEAEEYTELRRRIEASRDRLEELGSELDPQAFDSLLRDLDEDGPMSVST